MQFRKDLFQELEYYQEQAYKTTAKKGTYISLQTYIEDFVTHLNNNISVINQTFQAVNKQSQNIYNQEAPLNEYPSWVDRVNLVIQTPINSKTLILRLALEPLGSHSLRLHLSTDDGLGTYITTFTSIEIIKGLQTFIGNLDKAYVITPYKPYNIEKTFNDDLEFTLGQYVDTTINNILNKDFPKTKGE